MSDAILDAGPAAIPAPHVPPETNWRAMVAPYVKPSSWRALAQLATTMLPFLAVTAAMLTGLHDHIWAAALLSPIGAVLLVRLFMFQHDCGHGSFFSKRWANHALGSVLGVLTLTPYIAWRNEHAVHHATTGNLDRRGIGDVTTLTLAEYMQLSWLRRLGYRLYRHPLVMFGLGPVWIFFIINRIPPGNPKRQWREWLSVGITNAAIILMVAALIITMGPATLWLGWLPVTMLGATIGVWLFYVQHQFEAAYWEPRENWDFQTAALRGASFYDLPPVLHWLTGNIGFHHIHHLSSKIPNYRLRACHEANPVLQAAPRLTLWDSLKCARLALWDADAQRLIPFRKLK